MHAPLRKKLLTSVAATATVVGLLAVTAAPAGASGQRVSITTVLTGLNAPRGLALDGRGALFVSESGVAGDGPAGLTQSGRVSKFRLGSTTPVWSTSFSSFFAALDPTQPPDVLGPEGLSTTGNGCGKRDTHDDDESDHGRRGCDVVMIMSASHNEVLTQSGGAIDGPQIGHLFRLDGATGKATDLANVGDQQLQFTADHPNPVEPNPDSNPFGVLVTRVGDDDEHGSRSRTFVADAGANTLAEVLADGTTRVVALFPNDQLRDATPTCAAKGPDGMLYVGTLNLAANFTFGGGQSTVWRVNPDANFPDEPQVWATGLTTVTACTFDRAGNFWATEMFGPTGAPPFGDLVRIPFRHPSRLQRFGGGGAIPLPGGIAVGPDGAIYVSANSAAPGPAGQVLRVKVKRSDD